MFYTDNERATDTADDLSYLRYAPLSAGSFDVAWEKYYNYADRAKLIDNKVYFSNEVLRGNLVRDSTDFHSPVGRKRVDRDFKNYEIFFARLVERAEAINSYSGNLLIQYSLPILDNPLASANTLNSIMQFINSPSIVLHAASHKNSQIDNSAHWIVKKWSKNYSRFDLLSQNWKPEHRSLIETKCDAFLCKLGWDEETLTAVGIETKLKVIDS